MLAACGPRIAPLPLDSDPDPVPPRPVMAHAAPPPTPDADSLSEEDLPEVAATPATTTPTATAPTSDAGTPPPTPTGETGANQISPATPSPLDTIHPGTPPNVAAATRLADAARIRLAAGDDAAALEQLERAIAIDPNNAYAYFFLAQLHLHTHSYDQAIAFADRAASLSAGTSPEWTSRAWALQGNAYEAAGRFADARQAYLRAVHAAPNNLAALAGLARTGGGSTP
ncbi:MAG TPA: tetratricopeptide repeat protein [Frankiaceae bacterium]|nr:tetratricopeptide repeat protein [Frankiaceae bacterium]